MGDSIESSRDMAVIKGVIGVICILCCLPVSYSTDCEAPLGVEDDHFRASSEKKGHKATDGLGRLNGPKAWRPDRESVDAWIQVKFDTLVKVTKIATQGRNPDDKPDENEYVTSYKVQYGNDEDSLMYIRNANDTEDMVFDGNVDRGTTFPQDLLNGPVLKYIRIVIVSCSSGGCALRFELYGCKVCDIWEAPTNGHIINSARVFMEGVRLMIECDEWFTAMGETSTACRPTAAADGGDPALTWVPDISSTTCEHPCKHYQGLIPDQTDCTRYFNCDNNTPAPTHCGTDTYFNPTVGVCDWLDNGCAKPPVSTPASTTISSTSISRNPVNTPASSTISSTSISTNPVYTPASTTISSTSFSTNPVFTPASTTAEEYTPASITISPTSISSIGFDERRSDHRSNPGGAVAGSVIGVLLVIVIIIIVVIWLLKRKREAAKSTPQSGQAFDGPYELTIEGNNGPAKTQPTLINQPDQEEYAYVDLNKGNTPQNVVKSDTGDIYQDVQDKPDEYAYAYADVNASKTTDEPSDDGLVHIYAKSKHGGRPITEDKQNPAADTGDIYQSIQEAPNENEYAYADVKVDANGKPANPQEGWEDNVIYAAGDDDEGIAADKGKEGWVDNNIYATTDNDAQNAEGKSQVEGWEDNIIYGDK